MKRVAFAVFFILGCSLVAEAQQGSFRVPDCTQPFSLPPPGGGILNVVSIGTSNMFDNRGAGCTDWTIVYHTYGLTAPSIEVIDAPNLTESPGAVVAFAGTILGGVTQPIAATSTGTASMTGFFPYMGVALLSSSGSGAIEGVLYGYRRIPSFSANITGQTTSVVGAAADGAATTGNPVLIAGIDPTDTTVEAIRTNLAGGQLVDISSCSAGTCFVNDVVGSAVAVGTGTSTPFGTTTTLVQGIHLNNVCGAAVTVTMTDGNNVPYIGTTTNGPSFSMPAVSNQPMQMGLVGHVLTGGLQVSASVANCIKLWTEGKQ
jgi:hypothetical protein